MSEELKTVITRCLKNLEEVRNELYGNLDVDEELHVYCKERINAITEDLWAMERHYTFRDAFILHFLNEVVQEMNREIGQERSK